jgi:hypothetical protein
MFSRPLLCHRHLSGTRQYLYKQLCKDDVHPTSFPSAIKDPWWSSPLQLWIRQRTHGSSTRDVSFPGSRSGGCISCHYLLSSRVRGVVITLQAPRVRRPQRAIASREDRRCCCHHAAISEGSARHAARCPQPTARVPAWSTMLVRSNWTASALPHTILPRHDRIGSLISINLHPSTSISERRAQRGLPRGALPNRRAPPLEGCEAEAVEDDVASLHRTTSIGSPGPARGPRSLLVPCRSIALFPPLSVLALCLSLCFLRAGAASSSCTPCLASQTMRLCQAMHGPLTMRHAGPASWCRSAENGATRVPPGGRQDVLLRTNGRGAY